MSTKAFQHGDDTHTGQHKCMIGDHSECVKADKPSEPTVEQARSIVQELWRCGYLNDPSDERAEQAAYFIANGEWWKEQHENYPE